MKNLRFLLLILFPTLCFCQQNQSPKYFLNGSEFDLDLVFINPQNILSLNVRRDTLNAGLYFITKEKPWKYKTLEDLLKPVHNYNQIYDKSIIPIFIIEGIVINNPSIVKIDNTYYAEATLKSLSNVEGVIDYCKRLLLVDIKLADDPKKFIRIRGSNIPYLDSLRKFEK